MRILISILLLFSTSASFALTAQELNADKTLLIKASKGPKNRKVIEEDAYEQWENVTDINNLIDDGLIHSVYEGACDPEAYQMDEVEVVGDWPEIGFDFQSIKKGKSSKSIAYLVYPYADYSVKYTYYKTHADLKRRKLTEIETACKISAHTGFYYKNTKDKSVKFLGTTEDTEESEENFVGILFEGQSVVDLEVADKMVKALKKDKDVNICYAGPWVQAVENVNEFMEVFVNSDKGGKLDAEIEFEAESGTDKVSLVIKPC